MEPTTEPPPPVTRIDILPTYEAATDRDPFTLIALYVREEDLFSASLVSRQWRKAFMKEVWKRPDRLWELGDRPVLTKFLLFLRTLSTTSTPRIYTLSLSLTSVQPSIYSKLPTRWLSRLLLRLPNLQSLTLSSFPFFDHSSLLAILHSHAALQTLSITSCANTTPKSLTHLLAHLPQLINLDLSSTSGASHPSTLHLIATTLPELRCLSLRDLKLDDKALAPIIKSLGTRLWKLDVGGNLLTDKTIDLLLDYSFAPPEYYINSSTTETPSPPSDPSDGLTHLRIAANRISNTGVQGLLRSTRLEALDVGASLKGGVTGIVPALAMYAWKTLRTLRIDCRVVMQGLRPDQLKGLRSLVLCAVPEVASSRLTTAIVGVLAGLVGSGVEVVELEMDDGAVGGGVGMYSSSSGVDGSVAVVGDFSFFSGDPGEGEGGSSWLGEGGGGGGREVNVVEVVGAYRKMCRDAGTGWEGKVRVVRDLGGRGSIERGIGGERWGVVKEGV